MSEWINVKECLPKEGQQVIAFNGKYIEAGIYYFSGSFKYFDYSLKRHEITHWMPLPKPPIK